MLCGIEGEGGYVVGECAISYEASRSMRIEPDHEKEGKMMGVPECFETLLSNLELSGRIHEHNDEEHEVPRNTTRLGVMDLQCSLLSNLWYGSVSRKHQIIG